MKKENVDSVLAYFEEIIFIDCSRKLRGIRVVVYRAKFQGK